MGDKTAPNSDGFTHVDAEGHARMVDVSRKPESTRSASARAFVSMRRETYERVVAGDTAKGDVLATARLAGIMAAKQTPQLIPLCHPIGITAVAVDVEPSASARGPGVEIIARCQSVGRTGVEMEALTAASVAALTVYDMCKSIDRDMTYTVGLVSKDGGASGPWRRAERA
jgi:cyclic pyranopterin phosphate synthase